MVNVLGLRLFGQTAGTQLGLKRQTTEDLLYFTHPTCAGCPRGDISGDAVGCSHGLVVVKSSITFSIA
jgi:hypothetical protein